MHFVVLHATGSTKDHPAATCSSLVNKPSGTYWINAKESSSPFQVYCNMDIDGGGWTLVYAYGFTMYNTFRTKKWIFFDLAPKEV